MKRNFLLATSAAALLFGLSVNPADAAKAKATGWLNWRGPHQTGASDETNLPDEIDLKTGKNVLWKYDITGSGAPTIANGKVYTFAVRGEGQDLREYLLCLDAATGERIWEAAFNDYLSDIVYERYAIGSPTVDAETGNVYLQTTCGRFVCYSGDGKPLWEHSLMERFGRLTFPNGRTGSAIIDDDLVITRGITSYWGADGPARDRFYAFNKKNGELVWSSTPGTGPKDSSFATPVLAWKNGKRVFYTGTGCGNLVCVNARTGEPIFRYHFSFGGVNSSVLLHDNDKLIAVHGKENVDTSEVGRMVAISLKAEPKAGEKGPVVLTRNDELWRQPLVMFTSSPTLVGDRIYQVTHTGELECVDANTGKILWHQKLASGQLHASPLYADGKLYVPMGNGDFYILKLKDDGAEILDKETMGATLLGAPTVWNGRIYLHTKKSLYCFAKPGAGASTPKVANLKRDPRRNGKGEITSLQIVPSDLVLNPGDTKRVKVVGLDSRGFVLKKNVEATIDNFIPPTAKVKAEMDAKFNKNALVAKQDAKVSAGAFKAQAAGASGVMRGRVLPGFPFKEDFEGATLTVDHVGDGVKFAYPPLAWIGAHTERIRLGTGIAQMSARAPTATAMAALTLDHLSGGRVILGMGVSSDLAMRDPGVRSRGTESTTNDFSIEIDETVITNPNREFEIVKAIRASFDSFKKPKSVAFATGGRSKFGGKVWEACGITVLDGRGGRDESGAIIGNGWKGWGPEVGRGVLKPSLVEVWI